MKTKKAIVIIVALVLFTGLVVSNLYREISKNEKELSRLLSEQEYALAIEKVDSLRNRIDFKAINLFRTNFFCKKISVLNRVKGEALYGRNLFDQAQEEFARGSVCLGDEKELSVFMYNEGVALAFAGKYIDAMERFKRSLSFDPGNKEAANNLSIMIEWYRREQGSGEEEDNTKESGLNDFQIEDLNPWGKDKNKKSQEEEIKY